MKLNQINHFYYSNSTKESFLKICNFSRKMILINKPVN